jgi:FHS family L-fucose permease-like MFS transporter
MESFPFFLTALFTVGLGFQFNKLANPLAIKWKSINWRTPTDSGRWCKFFGTYRCYFIRNPLFGGDNKTSLSLEDIKLPFIILGLAFIVVAIFMNFSKIENPAKQEETVIKQIKENLIF